jgi:hypothetical protein
MQLSHAAPRRCSLGGGEKKVCSAPPDLAVHRPMQGPNGLFIPRDVLVTCGVRGEARKFNLYMQFEWWERCAKPARQRLSSRQTIRAHKAQFMQMLIEGFERGHKLRLRNAFNEGEEAMQDRSHAGA